MAQYGGTATFANRDDPPGLDPMRTLTVTLRNVAAPVFGDVNIVKPNPLSVYEPVASLADGWDISADTTVWTFSIRDGVKWHDGTAFTAEDVEFFFNLSLNPPGDRPTGAWARVVAGIIDTVEATDSSTVVFSLKQPTPSLLEALTNHRIQIAHPKHLMQPEIDAGNFTVSPADVDYVGLGPFVFDRFNEGSVWSVTRFDEYWEIEDGNRLPYLDAIDFAIVPDHGSVLAAFRTGRLDSTAYGSRFYVLPQQRQEIVSDLGESEVFFAIVNANQLSFSINISRVPWDDIRVRRAATLWFDKLAGIEAVYEGDGNLVGVFPPGSPFSNPDLFTWPGFNPDNLAQDRARAKELLAEAGYANGFKAVILCRDRFITLCEYQQGQLAEMLAPGEVSLNVVDSATYASLSSAGDFSLTAGSDSLGTSINGSFDTWASTNPGGATYHGDPKVDEAFLKILSLSPGDPQRYALGQEVERYILREKAYGVPLFTQLGVIAYRSYVKGVRVPEVNVNLNLDRSTFWLDK